MIYEHVYILLVYRRELIGGLGNDRLPFASLIEINKYEFEELG